MVDNSNSGGSLRLLQDRLVCRSANGYLLRRCSPEETLAIIMAARTIDSSSKLTSCLPLAGGAILLSRLGRQRIAIDFPKSPTGGRLEASATELESVERRLRSQLGAIEYGRRCEELIRKESTDWLAELAGLTMEAAASSIATSQPA